MIVVAGCVLCCAVRCYVLLHVVVGCSLSVDVFIRVVRRASMLFVGCCVLFVVCWSLCVVCCVLMLLFVVFGCCWLLGGVGCCVLFAVWRYWCVFLQRLLLFVAWRVLVSVCSLLFVRSLFFVVVVCVAR